ncbi:hypothetical protein [Rhizobium azibense]|uniref:hypothetical protein n=1 Tax=Rhizobium azibense TaxID=1136135 RepID=UPI001FDFF539|nr:hypothetical protein [Rhizobium azibense]
MSELRAAEDAVAQRASPEPAKRTGFGKNLNNKVVALFDSLPQIWANDATTDAHRKALLRCLIEKVVIDRGERDIALARIVWRGGAVTDLRVKMKVNSVAKLTRGEELRARLLELARTGMPDDEIAEILTREGHHSPNCEDKVLPITVQRLRLAAGSRQRRSATRWTHEPTLLSAVQLAARLDIPVNWIYVQIRRKRLLIDQPEHVVPKFPSGRQRGSRPSQPHHSSPRSENHSASPGGASTCVVEQIAELRTRNHHRPVGR